MSDPHHMNNLPRCAVSNHNCRVGDRRLTGTAVEDSCLSDEEFKEMFVQLSRVHSPLREEIFVGLCLDGAFTYIAFDEGQSQ